MEDELYYIGSYPDFPELAGECFIDIKNILNRVLSSTGLSIINTRIDNISTSRIFFEIEVPNPLALQCISYADFESKEELLDSMVKIVNSAMQEKGVDDALFYQKAMSDNEAYNDCNYAFSLLSKKAAIKFEDVRPKATIEYDADYLPFHSKEQLASIFNGIANLNENNAVMFEFVDFPDESDGSIDDIKVIFKADEKQEVFDFNIRDLDTIGLNLNKFSGLESGVYVASFINDYEGVIYSYCTDNEFQTLCKYHFLDPKYLPEDSVYKDTFLTAENIPPSEEEMVEVRENLTDLFGKEGLEKITDILNRKHLKRGENNE